MDRAELLDAFGELAGLLARRNVVGRIYIVGGAAMALAYDAQRTTRDVDALIVDHHGPVTEAVREIGRRRGWPSTWLNEQASAYIPEAPDRQQIVVFDHPALRVLAASPARMLAMKARAARLTDRDDIVRLSALVGAERADAVAQVFTEVFPGEQLSERSRAVVADILGESSTDD